MNLNVRKTPTFAGTATIPGSKSQTIRALILATLAQGETQIRNILTSDDSDDAKRVCEQLGACITIDGSDCTVQSSGLPLSARSKTLHTGNSGITTRFVLPLLGLRQAASAPLLLDCGEQMRARPIRSLVNALRQLGLQIQYHAADGMLPLQVSGVLQGGAAEIDGITSQYTSALLLALPCAASDSIITVHNLHERPYVEMTLAWLHTLGITFRHDSQAATDVFHISGRQHYAPFTVAIAGDFSSASYPIAAASLIPGDVTLCGLNMAEPQGDKRLVTILQQMGAHIIETAAGLQIQGGRPLQGCRIDANDIPDLLPTLAVIATQAQGVTEIVNVKQARIKETDRIHSMTEGLRAMGAQIEERADGLIIHPSSLHGATVKGYGDHRTVMALALAGMCADGVTVIDDAEAVAKTFPTFVPFMAALGAQLEVQSVS